jgi:hypothetical protein
VATVRVDVTAVNDAPRFAAGTPVAVDRAEGASTIAAWATAIAAGPGDEDGQALTFDVVAGNPTLFAAGPAIAPDGTLSFTPSGTLGTSTIEVTLRDDAGGTSRTETSTVQIFASLDHPVISEYRPDAFVEVFNPMRAPIDLGGWALTLRPKTGGGARRDFPIPLGTTLVPGGHLLFVGPEYTGSAAGDILLGGAGPRGVIAELVSPDGIAKDQVGALLPTIATTDPGSYERLDGRSFGSCVDTGDDTSDFRHNLRDADMDPQSLASVPTPCDSSPVEDPTVRRADGLVVSELRASGPAGLDDEFVELFNAGPSPLTLTGWTLRFVVRGAEATAFTFTAAVVPAGGHLLVASAGWSGAIEPDARFGSGAPLVQVRGLPNTGARLDGAGSVRLVDPLGTIVDVVGAEAATAEGRPLPGLGSGEGDSFERRAGGCIDTDDNLADFTHRFVARPESSVSVIAPPCS